jgi:hypothetical protein
MRRADGKLALTVVWGLGIAILAGAFFQRALHNLARIDYRNSNFVFFWLAGRMLDLGQNPYDSAQWLAQHAVNHVLWRSDRIFSYPLPLAFLFAPLGMFSLETAYVGWQLLTLAVVAVSVWLILRSAGAAHPERVFFPIVLGLLFFGPVYLSLQIGALGAFTLAAMTGAIVAFERRRDLLGGVLLSLLLLKPPQGLPVVLLGGIWLLFLKRSRAILGLALGLLGLLALGMIVDPAWPGLFAASSQGLLSRNIGLHSNAFSIAWELIGPRPYFPWILGGVIALLLAIAALAYLWRRRQHLTQLEAFSLIIPIGFLTAVYAWSYDQMLYVIPIAWVAGRLARTPRGYIAAFGFTLLVVATSLVALAVHAYTGTDVLSSATTLLVLVGLGAVLTRASP